MKKKHRSCIPVHMLLLAGLIPSVALAEKPTSPSPEPACTAPAAALPGEPTPAPTPTPTPTPAPEPAPKRDAAFLGIETAQADAATRQRLKLAEGTGLRVQFVAPKSPAADKLQVGDVLTHFSDQLLCNHDQLRALVRSKNSGDTVRLKFYRDGQAMDAEIKLGKTPAGPQSAFGADTPFLFQPDFNIRYDGKNVPLCDLLRDRVAELKDGIVTIDPETFKDLPEDVREMLKDLRGDFEKRTDEFKERREKRREKKGDDSGGKRENAEIETPKSRLGDVNAGTEKKESITIEITPDDGGGAIVSGEAESAGDAPKTQSPATPRSITRSRSFSFGDGLTSSVIINDDKGSVSSKKHGESRQVTIKDAGGKMIFDGPVDTDAQRDAMPDEAKKRLELIDSLAGK